MTLAPRRVIDAESLPRYPLGREERLDGNSFVKWQIHRWIHSRTFKLCSWEVQGMAFALFLLSQCESPVGTLPDDDEELAMMLRCTVPRLRELRAMELGPLRNWVPCLCDAERRLMHPVVMEQVRDALERRAVAQLSKEEKAVAIRQQRLRKALEKQGLGKDALADDVLIQRMDEWLMAHHRGNRTEAVYRSALFHASQQRWFGAARVV